MLIRNPRLVHCTSTTAFLSWTLVSVQSVGAQDDEDLSGALHLPPAIHATRLDYSEFDVPEAVTVISQEDIRLAGYLEISEIFRSVPGFRIWRFDANGYDGENKTGIRAPRLSGKQENDGSFLALSNGREWGESSRFDWNVSRNDQYEAIRNFGCFTSDTIAGARLVVNDPTQQAALLAPTRVLPGLLHAPLANICFFNDIAVDSDRTELQMEYE